MHMGLYSNSVQYYDDHVNLVPTPLFNYITFTYIVLRVIIWNKDAVQDMITHVATENDFAAEFQT